MENERIPLFPLNIVLFPGQTVPLHIFERRYRLMTRHCIESHSPFGMIFVHEGNLARIGCSALVTKTVKEYEDGRSDILIQGQRAFRLIRTHEDQPYFEADIEYVEEDLVGIDAEVTAQLDELFGQCYRIVFDGTEPPQVDQTRIFLAYWAASELPVDNLLRQRLLDLRSEAERQELLLKRLAEWYPQLQARESARGKAEGNGHSKL